MKKISKRFPMSKLSRRRRSKTPRILGWIAAAATLALTLVAFPGMRRYIRMRQM